MAIKVPSLARIGQRIGAYPMIVLGILCLGIIGYAGWQTYEEWYDQPLPASQVAAQRIHLNSAELQQLSNRLASYRGVSTPNR